MGLVPGAGREREREGRGGWQQEGDSQARETWRDPAAAGSGSCRLFFRGESSWLSHPALHPWAGCGVPAQAGPCLAEQLGEAPSHSSTSGAAPCRGSSQTRHRHCTRGPQPPRGLWLPARAGTLCVGCRRCHRAGGCPSSPCTPGLCSRCSQEGEGWLLSLGPADPGCFRGCSVHPSGTVTDSPKRTSAASFLGLCFWPEHPDRAPLKHPGCSAGSPAARGGCRRGRWCLCSPAGFVALLPFAPPFQGRAAAVFGFVVQALDLLLPGLCVFAH